MAFGAAPVDGQRPAIHLGRRLEIADARGDDAEHVQRVEMAAVEHQHVAAQPLGLVETAGVELLDGRGEQLALIAPGPMPCALPPVARLLRAARRSLRFTALSAATPVRRRASRPAP